MSGDEKKHDKKRETDAIDDVVKRLAKKYDASEEHVAKIVAREVDNLQGAKLRDYIPVLVEHSTKQALKAEKNKKR